jgi:phospho-N-acetylmuramoyl-pentapeptide-transferase
MGGAMVLISSLTAVALWASPNDLVIVCVLFYLACTLFGAIDDLLKIGRGNSVGLTACQKLLLQALLTIVVLCVARQAPPINNLLTHVDWPWFSVTFSPGVALIVMLIFYFLVFAGTSDAVNITDGVDGLAITNIMQCLIFFAVLAFYSCDAGVARKSLLAYIGGAGELAVLCSCFAGGCMAFWRFNAYPASVFMGDMGSMGLGGLLAIVASLLRQPFMLLIVGLFFVIEALSVMLQLTSKRLFHKKIFLMAPLHHHFELKGYAENKIVKVVFWGQALCLLIGFCVIFHKILYEAIRSH